MISKFCRKGHSRKKFGITRINRGRSYIECKECVRIGQKKRLISYKIKDPQYSRKYHLKHRYGITEEQFQFMLKLQGDKCPICLESSPRGKGFVVDHDHTTGEIRGIICDLCNKGLGALRDSELIVNNALSYLRKQVNDK